ncbi:hypothetical protein BS78_02G088300 [Paspalum vaginatum]|nr:hypothetical protein BS78_02G088300 [Paspalum vaginatum]
MVAQAACRQLPAHPLTGVGSSLPLLTGVGSSLLTGVACSQKHLEDRQAAGGVRRLAREGTNKRHELQSLRLCRRRAQGRCRGATWARGCAGGERRETPRSGVGRRLRWWRRLRQAGATTSPAAEGPGPRPAPTPLVLPPSSASSRVSLFSISSSGTLTPKDLSATLSSGSHSHLHALACAELRGARAGFAHAKYLSCGGFGPVYRGHVYGLDVAVKYYDTDCGTQGQREWLADVFFLASCTTPTSSGSSNTATRTITGCWCTSTCPTAAWRHVCSGSSMLVYECLPWMRRMEVAVGEARGLAFLHDADTPVICVGKRARGGAGELPWQASAWRSWRDAVGVSSSCYGRRR